MSHNLIIPKLAWIVASVAILCIPVCFPASGLAGVEYSDTLTGPLYVSGGEIGYNVDQDLDVVASLEVKGTTGDEAGDGTSFDFNSAAALGAKGSPSGSGGAGLHVGGVGGPGKPIFPPAPIDGDVNEDGHVDLQDYFIIQINFLSFVSTRGEGDLNGDGVVNLQDYFELQINFGNFLVPEPASLAVFGGCFVLGGLVLRRRKRRTGKISR